MTTKVSFLMSVFNEKPAFLERSLTSLLDQSFTAWNALVINDGSTRTDTNEFLRSFATRDPRIRIIEQSNKGLTASLNFGLQQLEAHWVARHDSDDWSHPDRLHRQMHELDSNSHLKILGCQPSLVNEKGKLLFRSSLPQSHEEIEEFFFRGNPFCHGSVIFDREAALAIGGYDETFSCTQDYDFFYRLGRSGRMRNLEASLYYLRRTTTSLSATRPHEQIEATHRIRRQIASDRGLRLQSLPDIASTDGQENHSLRMIDDSLLSGNFLESLRIAARLLQKNPCRKKPWLKLLRAFLFYLIPISKFRGFLFGN